MHSPGSRSTRCPGCGIPPTSQRVSPDLLFPRRERGKDMRPPDLNRAPKFYHWAAAHAMKITLQLWLNSRYSARWHQHNGLRCHPRVDTWCALTRTHADLLEQAIKQVLSG
jgi:hypothetical protein